MVTGNGCPSVSQGGTLRTQASHPNRASQGGAAISQIFVNFRVGDAQDTAVLIDEKLCRVFGSDAVFRSSRAIPAGSSFAPELLRAAAECSVMLVVIGPNWLTITDDSGCPKLHSPGDWVRFEIELALRHGARVVPVLVGDVKLPAADQLPSTIAELPGKQHIRLHHRQMDYGLMQVADEIRRILQPNAVTSLPPRPNTSLVTTLPVARRSPDISFGPADINGRHYGDSIIFRCSLFCHEPRGSVDFNLGRGFRRLEVTAGVLDDAADAGQTGVFQVVLDEVAQQQLTARQGEPRFIRVDVTDVLHMRLVAYRPGTTVSPLMAGARLAGGQSNYLPELAWGDPVLHA